MKPLEPIDNEFFGQFNSNECDLCGECLMHCPIISYTKEESSREIKALINNQETSRLLKECQSCFTCNFHCPKGLNLTSLILKRWNELYKKDGLKIRGKYFMTLYPNYPNFRTYVLNKMNREEKTLLENWRSLEPLKGDTLTYPGCNVILTPTLTEASFFKELDIRGQLEYCCGETLFRTGYADQLHQVTKRLDKWFNILKPKNLLVLCTAGTNVFKNVLPNYGLTYKFDKITSYIEWLWERLENGQIEIKKPLNFTVTIQDSCYSKMFGDNYMDLPRKILEKLGCEVIEMEQCREDMRCCGIAAGFSVDSAYNVLKIRKYTAKNMDMAKKTKADVLCVYCSGCNQMYNSARYLYLKPFNMKIYHIIELIQLAIGEQPKRLIKKTAKQMFIGNIKNALPKIPLKRTFKLDIIPEDPHPDAY